MNSSESTTSGQIFFGSKSFGIGLAMNRKKNLVFGPFSNPWIRIQIKKELWKGSTKKSDKKSFRIKGLSFYTKIFYSVTKSIHWEEVSITGKLGLKNPMHTGIIYGIIQGTLPLVRSNRFMVLVIPLFENQLKTDLDGSICFKFQPAIVAWHTTKAYLKFKS